MTWFTAIVTYLLLWWLTLFTVLPWGNKMPEEPEQGHATSAPVHPNLKLKFLVTSCISAILLLLVYILIEIKIIDFRAIAIAMMEEGNVK